MESWLRFFNWLWRLHSIIAATGSRFSRINACPHTTAISIRRAAGAQTAWTQSDDLRTGVFRRPLGPPRRFPQREVRGASI